MPAHKNNQKSIILKHPLRKSLVSEATLLASFLSRDAESN